MVGSGVNWMVFHLSGSYGVVWMGHFGGDLGESAR